MKKINANVISIVAQILSLNEGYVYTSREVLAHDIEEMDFSVSTVEMLQSGIQVTIEGTIVTYKGNGMKAIVDYNDVFINPVAYGIAGADDTESSTAEAIEAEDPSSKELLKEMLIGIILTLNNGKAPAHSNLNLCRISGYKYSDAMLKAMGWSCAIVGSADTLRYTNANTDEIVEITRQDLMNATGTDAATEQEAAKNAIINANVEAVEIRRRAWEILKDVENGGTRHDRIEHYGLSKPYRFHLFESLFGLNIEVTENLTDEFVGSFTKRGLDKEFAA